MAHTDCPAGLLDAQTADTWCAEARVSLIKTLQDLFTKSTKNDH